MRRHAARHEEFEMKQRFPAWALCLLASVTAPAWAGTANVKFVDPGRYSDAGPSGWERDDNLKVLASHLQELARRQLPEGQTLNIEVLDVDLAGEVRPRRNGYMLRVTRGMADWPQMTVRYTLQDASGQTLRQAEDHLSDPSYQQRTMDFSNRDPLRYEKRMLDDWFRKTFSQAQARSGG
jgi:hypothetical protein